MILTVVIYISVFSVFILGICLLIFLIAQSNIGFKKNYKIGVIKTSTQKLKSYIDYYDGNLNLLFSRRLFLCDTGHCVTSVDNKKYILSKGNYWIPCHYVTELDSKTGKIKNYKIDVRHNLAMTANKNHIFTTYTIKDAHIHRYNKKTSTTKKPEREIIISGMCNCMYVDNNILYAFASDSHRKISNLYVIDAEEMQILKVFDIKNRGYYQKVCVKVIDDLYFLNFIRHKNDNFVGEPCHTLTKFNTNTNEFRDIEINYWPRQLVKFQNLIYISHNDCLYSSANNNLTIYDTKSKKITILKTDNANYHLLVDEEKKILYSSDGLYLYQYELPSLRLLQKIKICNSIDPCFVSVLFLK